MSLKESCCQDPPPTPTPGDIIGFLQNDWSTPVLFARLPAWSDCKNCIHNISCCANYVLFLFAVFYRLVCCCEIHDIFRPLQPCFWIWRQQLHVNASVNKSTLYRSVHILIQTWSMLVCVCGCAAHSSVLLSLDYCFNQQNPAPRTCLLFLGDITVISITNDRVYGLPYIQPASVIITPGWFSLRLSVVCCHRICCHVGETACNCRACSLQLS